MTERGRSWPSIDDRRRVAAGPGRGRLSPSAATAPPARRTKKETLLSAHSSYLTVDANGVFPTLLLFFVFVLTTLGVVAHAAFV